MGVEGICDGVSVGVGVEEGVKGEIGVIVRVAVVDELVLLGVAGCTRVFWLELTVVG